MVRAFIQARMNSARFPGKVLAPFNGRPIITHVIERVAEVLPITHITVATSTEESDDPLVRYLQNIGILVHRGPLENVLARLQSCLKEYDCAWFFRISADSPLLNSRIVRTMLDYRYRSDVDLISNVFPRTFPKGHSVEMLSGGTFLSIDADHATAEEKEHVTKVYYNHPDKFRIINIASTEGDLSHMNLAVDTTEDLQRLETFSKVNSLRPGATRRTIGRWA